MSSQGERINRTAFTIVEMAAELLDEDGAVLLDVEVQTAIGCAYVIICKMRGHTFEQIAPILAQTFEAAKRTGINTKGGEA